MPISIPISHLCLRLPSKILHPLFKYPSSAKCPDYYHVGLAKESVKYHSRLPARCLITTFPLNRTFVLLLVLRFVNSVVFVIPGLFSWLAYGKTEGAKLSLLDTTKAVPDNVKQNGENEQKTASVLPFLKHIPHVLPRIWVMASSLEAG